MLVIIIPIHLSLLECFRSVLGLFSTAAHFKLINAAKLRRKWKSGTKDQSTSLDNSRLDIEEYRILRKLNFRKQTCFAVGIIDLDGFKAVNDTHGHHRGDGVLLQFLVLKKPVAPPLLPVLGGDEFDYFTGYWWNTGTSLWPLNVLEHYFKHYGCITVWTFSSGLPSRWTTWELKMQTKIADQSMYQSKSLG